ncbi:unnamed protein product [Ilex paraguariensis]|uniref:RING-type domain-containing protein n=1 Tax=Ilex paraguariensis TaxID=185542 RepID=A0ABC8SNY9_9AQUA
MAVSSLTTIISKQVQTLRTFLLGLVKHILMVVLSCIIPLFNRANLSGQDTDDSEMQYRPLPSMVPIPVHFLVESAKEQLPIVEFSRFSERLAADDDKDRLCIVCLGFMKSSDEMRELCNCCHVFHRYCLDAWIDQGQMTCPLCRSKLLPAAGGRQKLKCGGDPWRKERMIYLFGEESVTSSVFMSASQYLY